MSFFSTLLILTILTTIAGFAFKKYGHLFDYLYVFLLSKYRIRQFLRSDWTVADLFEDRVKKSPTKVALIFEGKTWTYSQLDREANKMAAWAYSEGLRPKQVVALMMENRPEFIITWLGLSKIGVTSSLINTNLRGTSLTHCLNVCDAQVVIAGPECTIVIDEFRSELKTSKLWVFGIPTPIPGWGNLTTHMSSAKDCEIQSSQRAGVGSNDLLFYIYTSGTTGLPKAAKIKHIRYFLAGLAFSGFHHLNADDRIYCPLPLYHSAAGMIGVGSAWCVGASVVLRSKFSASNFFRDCYENNCTVIQYIGQICRYLLNTPHGEYDRSHFVQKAIGNGMQVEVWEQFQKRFNIPYIGEFYASTEGNANLINNQNKVGACGYIPKIAEIIYPIAIVAYDHDKEQPIRDAQGRCTRVGDNVPGELLGLVVHTDPIRQFDGYTVQKSNDDKMLRNVFKDGDCWFRTGDLLRRDAEGFIYFVDRIGDTFRWKGENVATSEVSAVMSNFPGFAEINVYGVSVPHNEGRAGMASISLTTGLPPSTTSTFNDPKYDSIPIDWSALYQFLSTNLPSYQQPLFIRIQGEMIITTTFKHKKGDMVKDGFDPNIVSDPIFFRDDSKKTFVPLTIELYQALLNGKVRI